MQISHINNIDNSYKAENTKSVKNISYVSKVSFGQDSFNKQETNQQKSVVEQIISAVVKFVEFITNLIKKIFGSKQAEQTPQAEEIKNQESDKNQSSPKAEKSKEVLMLAEGKKPVALLPEKTQTTIEEEQIKRAKNEALLQNMILQSKQKDKLSELEPEVLKVLEKQTKEAEKSEKPQEVLMLPEGKKPVALLPEKTQTSIEEEKLQESKIGAEEQSQQDTTIKTQKKQTILMLPEARKPIALLPAPKHDANEEEMDKVVEAVDSAERSEHLEEIEKKSQDTKDLAQSIEENPDSKVISKNEETPSQSTEKKTTSKIIPITIDSSKIQHKKKTQSATSATHKTKVETEESKQDYGFPIIIPEGLQGFDQIDIKTHDSGEKLYFKMTNPITRESICTWYNKDGSVLCFDEIDIFGSLDRMYYYDKYGKVPRCEERTQRNGEIEVTHFTTKGKIDSIKIFSSDKKSVISEQKYKYNKQGKVEMVTYSKPDGNSQNIWLNDEGTPTCRLYSKNKKPLYMQWLYNDGKTIRTQEEYNDDGTTTQSSFDENENIRCSITVDKDKNVVDETAFQYSREGKLATAITKYPQTNEKITTWYNSDKIPTFASFEKDGKIYKNVEYYEDGITQKNVEYTFANGNRDKLKFDRHERWLVLTSYLAGSKEHNSITTYKYADETSEDAIKATKTYSDGKQERMWFGENETLQCRQTLKNGVKTKCEWFYDDGETLKAEVCYNSDGIAILTRQYDEKGNIIAA